MVVAEVSAGVWVSLVFTALGCARPSALAVKRPVNAAVTQSPRPSPSMVAPDAALAEAICTGNLAAVEQRLAAGVSADAAYEGCSLLIGAIGCFQTAVAKLLLERGANPSSHSPEGATAFQLAMGNPAEVAQLLLEHGFPVNESTPEGYAPLHMAAMTKRADIVKLLLARGANPNVTDRQGFTPLAFAVNGNDLTSISELLAGGADPTLAGADSSPPLQGASSAPAFELLRDAVWAHEPQHSVTIPPLLLINLLAGSDAAAPACREQSPAGGVAAELWVSFVVEPDGSVSGAAAIPTLGNVRDQRVIRCVLGLVRAARFPKVSLAASYMHRFQLSRP